MSQDTRTTASLEKFAQLVARGMHQSEAYRSATGSKANDTSVYSTASKWASKVRTRIEELRGAVRNKATTRYVYEYEDAMREIDEAIAAARKDRDHGAVMRGMALKSKLSGLETDARVNERPPFTGVTDDELIEGINRDMVEAGCTVQ
ncbi:MAG TPA: hypothetical protein VN878_05900 [Usitatibacter sp.]|nr:hypothetical protein [Usitatibacter sp.]